jgi:nucleoid-associated protein YgaU
VAAAAAAAPPAPAAPAPRTHRVTSGDTLTRISSRYYGTATRWQEIFNANRDKLRNPDVLPLGVELRIP